MAACSQPPQIKICLCNRTLNFGFCIPSLNLRFFPLPHFHYCSLISEFCNLYLWFLNIILVSHVNLFMVYCLYINFSSYFIFIIVYIFFLFYHFLLLLISFGIFLCILCIFIVIHIMPSLFCRKFLSLSHFICTSSKHYVFTHFCVCDYYLYFSIDLPIFVFH